MPTVYFPVELSNEQRETLAAATAIAACDAHPTQQAIAQFSGLSPNKVASALRTLKSIGLVTVRRVKA